MPKTLLSSWLKKSDHCGRSEGELTSQFSHVKKADNQSKLTCYQLFAWLYCVNDDNCCNCQLNPTFVISAHPLNLSLPGFFDLTGQKFL